MYFGYAIKPLRAVSSGTNSGVGYRDEAVLPGVCVTYHENTHLDTCKCHRCYPDLFPYRCFWLDWKVLDKGDRFDFLNSLATKTP